MDKDLASAYADADLIMNALEGYVFNSARKLTVGGGADYYVLGADNNVYRRVFAEALVNAFKLSAEYPYSAVVYHNAVKNVRLTDKVGYKGVYGLVVYVLGRAYLLDNAVVHNNNAVAHGKGFFLVVGDVDKRLFCLLLDLFKLKLHALTQL